MKMAKASEADLKMAMELAHMLEAFERGFFMTDSETDSDFRIDLGSHCQSAMLNILDKCAEGSLMRVVYGMAVLLDPRNECVDPDLDHIDHHPKTKLAREMHDELVAALRVFVDKYNAAPDGELGIGLVNGDFIMARDILAKLEGR